ncbi:MAG TPA: hypothetical protein VFE05_19105 [Longimicrobiaceae bacterium]|jgi:hypothetical protein|nr:hypothetical protein [Longimicrobiaceae bacterium]
MTGIDASLLPEAFRAATMTRGEYNRRLPELPDAALCNHAEVYAGQCAAQRLQRDPEDPAAYLHFFVLPELVARVGGTFVREASPPDPNSPFRRVIDWTRLEARVAAEIAAQRELAGLGHRELAAVATAAQEAVHCRWNAGDPVYDAVVHHTIIPELIRRIRTSAPPQTRDKPKQRIRFTVYGPVQGYFIPLVDESRRLAYTVGFSGALRLANADVPATRMLEMILEAGTGRGDGLDFVVGRRGMAIGDVVHLDVHGVWICALGGWNPVEGAEAERFPLAPESPRTPRPSPDDTPADPAVDACMECGAPAVDDGLCANCW